MPFDGRRVGSLSRGGGGGREVSGVRGDPSSAGWLDALALDDHTQEEVGAAIRQT